ncbi:MAG: hypothetical protein J0H68_09535 [Sphingobacteriia bacterium]|nr:hypothetical protein [Sphingobacteriia bacterium]
MINKLLEAAGSYINKFLATEDELFESKFIYIIKDNKVEQLYGFIETANRQGINLNLIFNKNRHYSLQIIIDNHNYELGNILLEIYKSYNIRISDFKPLLFSILRNDDFNINKIIIKSFLLKLFFTINNGLHIKSETLYEDWFKNYITKDFDKTFTLKKVGKLMEKVFEIKEYIENNGPIEFLMIKFDTSSSNPVFIQIFDSFLIKSMILKYCFIKDKYLKPLKDYSYYIKSLSKKGLNCLISHFNSYTLPNEIICKILCISISIIPKSSYNLKGFEELDRLISLQDEHLFHRYKNVKSKSININAQDFPNRNRYFHNYSIEKNLSKRF